MNRFFKIMDDFLRPIDKFLESKLVMAVLFLIVLVFLGIGIYLMYSDAGIVDQGSQNLQYPVPR